MLKKISKIQNFYQDFSIKLILEKSTLLKDPYRNFENFEMFFDIFFQNYFSTRKNEFFSIGFF